ncbi:MAG: hypothetical protein LBP60_07980, partial [Spirochaetaceae bacterium]|nr:hypothetical protein [Spirochaetaceae bacterium]
KVAAPLIEKNGTGFWRISGAASLDKVEKETGVPLPVEQYDTFGGFVFTLLGRVPDDGERCELLYPAESGGNSGGADQDKGILHITVTEVKEHRLESALVRLSGGLEKS